MSRPLTHPLRRLMRHPPTKPRTSLHPHTHMCIHTYIRGYAYAYTYTHTHVHIHASKQHTLNVSLYFNQRGSRLYVSSNTLSASTHLAASSGDEHSRSILDARPTTVNAALGLAFFLPFLCTSVAPVLTLRMSRNANTKTFLVLRGSFQLTLDC